MQTLKNFNFYKQKFFTHNVHRLSYINVVHFVWEHTSYLVYNSIFLNLDNRNDASLVPVLTPKRTTLIIFTNVGNIYM
jgi:hypothetical protein